MTEEPKSPARAPGDARASASLADIPDLTVEPRSPRGERRDAPPAPSLERETPPLTVMHGSLQEQLEVAAEPPAPPSASEIELGGSLVPRARTGARVARSVDVRSLPSEAPSFGTIVARVRPALRVIAAGVSVMVADFAYAAWSGTHFELGPVRAIWLAAPLVIYGLFKLVLSLVA